MKKITLLFLALVVGITINAQNPRVISHSTDQTPIEGSVACAANNGSGTTDNNFWRAYTPADFGETGNILLTGGEIGIAFTDIFGSDPTVEVVVRAFTTDAAFPSGNLTEIATGTVSVTAADNLTLVPFSFDTPAEINATQEIAISFSNPDGTAVGFDIRIAQNDFGETDLTYISTDVGCGAIPITSFDDIGFPGNGILNMVVDDVLSANDNVLAETISLFPNPTKGDLNIEFARNLGNTTINIINVSGQKVLTSQVESVGSTILPTSALASGVYFAQVLTEQGTTTMRFVKN